MRNLYADGSLMVVDPVAVATVDIPDKKVLATTNDGKGSEKLVRGRKGVAWTVCHAFKNEKQYSFLLINRDLKNPRQIKLVLPYEPEAKAVFHMLTNPDPKSNNRKEYNVKLTELETGDFKNGAVITVPPASVYLIVNNAR